MKTNGKCRLWEMLVVIAVILAVDGRVTASGEVIPIPGEKNVPVQVSPWGREDKGLQCIVLTCTEIEQGMPLNVTCELKSIPENLDPDVKQLNLFLYDEYLKLILKNIKTQKVFTIRPFRHSYVGGPLVRDDDLSTALLDGKPLKPLKARFPLVRLYNDLAPGLYECTVEYSFPKEKARWWRSKDWESFGFWYGTAISGSFQLRILKETPKTTEFFAPERLHYFEREGKVDYTRQDAVRIELPVRNGHFIDTLVCGKKNCFSCRSGVPVPDGGAIDNCVSILKGKPWSYTVKVVETSDPPRHLSMPWRGSPGYKLLWEQTFIVERPESRKNYELTARYLPPWLPSTQERATLTASTDEVRAFAISPDGKTLATEDNYGTLELWDVAGGDRFAKVDFDEYTAPDRALAFSPDNKIVASRQSDNIITTEVATGKKIATSQKSYGSSMAFSPDGRILAVGHDRVVLLDAATLRELPRLDDNMDSYNVAFSSNGKILALAGDGSVRFWNIARRRKIASLRSDHGVDRMVFSPNGKVLATGNHDGIELWDVAQRRVLAFIRGLDRLNRGWFAFSPDGKILAAADGYGMIALYRVPAAEPIAILDNQSGVYGLGFLPKGHTIVAAGSETIRFWDVTDLLVRALSQEKILLSKSNSTSHLKLAVSVPQDITVGGPVDMLITLTHDWPEEITLGQDNHSHNCTIQVFDSNGQPCHLTPLGKEVRGGTGIDLLLYSYNCAPLEPGEYHTWIDLTRYFQLKAGKYAVWVVVDLNRDGYPAKATVEDLKFEVVAGVLTNAR